MVRTRGKRIAAFQLLSMSPGFHGIGWLTKSRTSHVSRVENCSGRIDSQPIVVRKTFQCCDTVRSGMLLKASLSKIPNHIHHRDRDVFRLSRAPRSRSCRAGKRERGVAGAAWLFFPTRPSSLSSTTTSLLLHLHNVASFTV